VKGIRRFSKRQWTQSDDDKLRTLVIAGASLGEIGAQIGSHRNCGPIACWPAKDYPQKIKIHTTPIGWVAAQRGP
jgi:hypothetical protein